MVRIIIALLVLLARVSAADAARVLWFPFDHTVTPNCGFGCYSGHGGTDYPCDEGTSIYASISGVVRTVVNTVPGQSCGAGYGNHVVIEDTQNALRVYEGHMLPGSIVVIPGEQVSAGQFIGRSSNSGYTATLVNGQYLCGYGGGYHLHLETRVLIGGTWTPVDPYTYANGTLWTDPLLYGNQPPPPLTYGAAYAAQTPTDPSGILHLVANETRSCSFTFQNRGTATWTNSGASPNYVELHSVNASWNQDQASGLASNWLAGSSVRVATTTGEVAPGGSGLYSFSIRTPAAPGSYTLYVALYHPDDGRYISGTGPKIQIDVAAPPSIPTFTAQGAFRAGDVNGDSTKDLVYFARGTDRTVWVALSSRAGFRAFRKWADLFCYDNEWPEVADFTGDGRADIVTFTRGTTGDVFVGVSSDSQFVLNPATKLWSGDFCYNDEWPVVADFTGDGKADIATFTRGTLGYVYVGYSDGGQFVLDERKLWLTGFCYGNEWPLAGDFTGDGKADIATCTRGTLGYVYVATSSGEEFLLDEATKLWSSDFCYGSELPASGRFTVDNRADIATFVQSVRYVYVGYSDGGHVVLDENKLWHTNFAGTGEQPLVGDFDGDGIDDIAKVNADYSVDVTRSWGSAFSMPARWYTKPATGGGHGGDEELDKPTLTPGWNTLLALSADSSPNPFNPTTEIRYSLPVAAHVRLTIHDITGRRVATLVNREDSKGEHLAVWDARGFASGLYVYRLVAGDHEVTQKLVLLK